jgi:hypothetical protein
MSIKKIVGAILILIGIFWFFVAIAEPNPFGSRFITSALYYGNVVVAYYQWGWLVYSGIGLFSVWLSILGLFLLRRASPC